MTEASAELLDRALVEESAKKSGLVWVSTGSGGDRAEWHVWHEGAVVVVGEGAEQPLHGWAQGDAVTVTVRSKDTWGRLLAWPARVEELPPGSAAWSAAVEELKAKRLNSPDFATVTERWARESRVLRGVLEGQSNKEIGAQLVMTESSVKAVLQKLFERTGVRSRSQLVRYAIEAQIDPR